MAFFSITTDLAPSTSQSPSTRTASLARIAASKRPTASRIPASSHGSCSASIGARRNARAHAGSRYPRFHNTCAAGIRICKAPARARISSVGCGGRFQRSSVLGEVATDRPLILVLVRVGHCAFDVVEHVVELFVPIRSQVEDIGPAFEIKRQFDGAREAVVGAHLAKTALQRPPLLD